MKKLIIIFTSLLLFFSFSVQPKAKLKDNPTKNYGVMISPGLNFEYATYYSKPNEKPMGKLKHATALKKVQKRNIL